MQRLILNWWKGVEFLVPRSWTIPGRTEANSGGSHVDIHLALGCKFPKVKSIGKLYSHDDRSFPFRSRPQRSGFSEGTGMTVNVGR